MEIIKVDETQFDIVKMITHTTIQEIYPRFYPAGCVNFFLSHHNDQNIFNDLLSKSVYLIYNIEQCAVGTITIKGNEIGRLFVLPAYQKKGYGKQLIDFAEKKIAKSYESIQLDTSLASKMMYIKRGYKEKETHSFECETGEVICFDVMSKNCSNANFKINYDGKVFVSECNSDNGEVSDQTTFYYHQQGNILWGEYSGGEIRKGNLIGTVNEKGELAFSYQHLNQNNDLKMGICHSVATILSDGMIKLEESWKWLNGDESTGFSTLVEKVLK